MPGTDKHGMIDGYHSVQAARRAAGRDRPAAPEPPPTAPPPPAPPGGEPGRPQRASHTALPTKHHIACYSCTYEFTVTGQLKNLICPKCREQLESGDIDVQGPWSRDVKTVGTVNIQPDAILTSGTIIATDIVVRGDVRKADLRPTRRIELAMAAVINPVQLEGRDVYVRPEAQLAFDATLRCRILDVAGELTATLEPGGCVTIRAGGCVRGAIKAAHLVIEDGAGLSARLDIRPTNAPPAAAPEPAANTLPLPRTRRAPHGPAGPPEPAPDKPSTEKTKLAPPGSRAKQASKRGPRKLR